MRNRSACGEKNGRSKLTNEKVLKILEDNITPRTELARMYGVNAKVIRDIKGGKTWKGITGL